MNCFRHADQPAVGICPACHKGVCRACVVDLGRGIACRGNCEVEARRILDLRDFSFSQPSLQEKMLGRGRQMQRLSGLTLTGLGALMAVFGLYSGQRDFLVSIGAIMGFWGLMSLLLSTRSTANKQFRLCRNCGYNITGNTTGRCSECGHVV